MEKKRAVILFADIKGSTEVGYSMSRGLENYNSMIRDYHATIKAAITEYCEKFGLDKARLTCSAKGDECCLFVIGGVPGEDEEHALRLAVYLKERWKQSEFVVRLQQAAGTQLYPQVDLRIGIGSGEVACDQDCWTGQETLEGVRISEAKRIEGMAEEAAETLIMVKWEVKDACQRTGLDVEFGDGRRLRGKGVPEGADIAVYPVLRYGPWAQVQQTVPKANKPDWSLLYDKALGWLNSGGYDSAVRLFQGALTVRPNLHEAYRHLGIAYAKQQNYDAAVNAYGRALLLRPDFPEALYGLGVAYRRRGDFDQAIEAYRKAIELRPDYVKAWNNLGFAYYSKRSYTQAKEAYEKALELQPDYPRALYNLGLISYLRGDEKEARRRYGEADRLNPDPDVRAYNWACLYAQMGDTRNAFDNLRQALEIDVKYKRIAASDPSFVAIREHPEFRRLVGVSSEE